MQNSKNSRGILAIAGAHVKSPVIEVRSYALAGTGCARVVVDVTHAGDSRTNHRHVADAIRAKFSNKMEAVAGSFFSLEKGPFVERITGVVGAVREIMSADAESLKGFSAFASNMFMDDEQHMWAMHKTKAGKILVKSTGIDDDASLTSMLESCSSAIAGSNRTELGRMLAQASATVSAVEAGDFISYVTADNLIGHGFVVASVAGTDTLIVAQQGDADGETINRMAVTQIHGQEDFPEVVETKEEEVATVMAAARGIDLEFLLSYYKKVYARSPSFFAQFAQRLQNHAFC